MTVAFFVELDTFPAIPKRDVDAGRVPAVVASTCDLLRAVFFTSNGMRKERDVWFHVNDEQVIVRFTGETMRYLGPDERSMLMLLLQARVVLDARGKAGLPGAISWRRSTPGIDVATGVSRDEAMAACVAAYPGRPWVSAPFARQGGGLDTRGIPGSSFVARVPAPGGERVITRDTGTVDANDHLDDVSLQVLLLNLALDNQAGGHA